MGSTAYMALGLGTVWAALAAMATSMVVGFVWYGPIWGKTYMRLIGAEGMSAAESKEAQKAAAPGYVSSLVTVGGSTVVIAFLFDWAFPGSGYSSAAVFGLSLGTAGWFAFYVPGTFTNRFFLRERPPLALWWITSIYWLMIGALSGFYVGLFQ